MRLTVFLITLMISACSLQSGKKKEGNEDQLVSKEFSIGLIADCQYCNAADKGQRKYSFSDQKLQTCVDHLNTLDLAYTVHLGDFIDKDWESFDVVGPIYEELTMPAYHVLGNHDFSVKENLKGSVVRKMGLDSAYYHFSSEGWRFIVLNGNDISFHAYPEDSEEYKAAEDYYSTNQISSPRWNGALGHNQMIWLEKVLQNAKAQSENVILYCHFPVFPENQHNLWNAAAVVDLLEQYSNVKAYINGHNHEGNYAMKNGIHYLTMRGMVDTEETSYGIMSISKDRIKIKGIGREEDRILEINKFQEWTQ